MFTLYLIVLVVFLIVGAILVLALDLPSMLIVGTIVQKLAAVAETTESAVFFFGFKKIKSDQSNWFENATNKAEKLTFPCSPYRRLAGNP